MGLHFQKYLFRLAALSLFLSLSAIVGLAQTSAFTYQGRLTDGGTAANGNYDLQFALFDNVAGGTQIGATQTSPNVPVSAGIFTVPLDFGASAFPGAPRFLEISARLVGTPSFTTLAPRQPITSTPYAIRSLNASSADAVTVNGVPGGSGNYIQNNPPSQQAGNFNISGNGTVGSTLSAGVVNSATQYNIGGNRVFVSEEGMANTFAGIDAGIANANIGFLNAFFGRNAGRFNKGNFNAFFGESAGFNNVNGGGNAFFGRSAGVSNTEGSENTVIGYSADVGSNNLTNATAIGADARVDQSNALVLGSIAGVNGSTASVKVGIGTTTPAVTLDVVGSLKVSSGATITSLNVSNGATITGTNGDGAVITARRSTGDPFVVIDATTVAQNSVLAFRKNNFNRWLMYTDNSSESGGNAGSDFKLDAYNNSGGIANYLFVKRSTGAVGIGTTSPFVNTKLDIVGGLLRLDQLAAGGDEPLCRNSAVHTIATCNASSLRYKESVQPLRQGLHLIQRLRPVTFNWQESGRADLGLIAEEVAKVEPLLTFKNDKGEIEGVRYDRLNVILINAVKQQQTQIETLRAENDALNARLRSVERILSKRVGASRHRR